MSGANVSLPGMIETPSTATWENLVLPHQVLESVREYALWVSQREKVQREWGAGVTGGPIALFSGRSAPTNSCCERARK